MTEKNHFRQHIPSFYEGFDSVEFDFDTLEELLNNPIIKKWEENVPNYIFHRFSKDGRTLMVEFNNGKKWYVVGSVKYMEELLLPEWEPNYV